jgi:ribosomal protein L37AE/L43A
MITIDINKGVWVCTNCNDAGRDHTVEEVPTTPVPLAPGVVLKCVLKCSTCGYWTNGAGLSTPAEEELF